MALVTSVVFLTHGLADKKDIPRFMETHYPKVAELKPRHFESVGPKCCEIDVRSVGFNYLDVEGFYARFEAFDWSARPTVIVRPHESDLVHIHPGFESRVHGDASGFVGRKAGGA